MRRDLTYLCWIIVGLLAGLLSGGTSLRAQEADSLETLSKIAGADMALYRLYDELIVKNPAEAMTYAEFFWEKLDTNTVHPIPARMANNLADYYEKQRFQYTDAINWRLKALSSYQRLQDDYHTALTLYNLARIHYRTRQYHKTLESLNAAITLLTPQGNPPLLSECYNLLGATHFLCMDYPNAKRYFERYAAETMTRKDSSKIPIALNNIAVYAQYQGDTAKSRKLIETAVEICKEHDNEEMLVRSYLNLASNLIESQNIKGAQQYLDLAEPRVYDIEMKGQFYKNTSLIHQSREEWDKSIETLLLAIEQYKQGEFGMDLQNCYSRLIEIYRQIGNEEAAAKTALAYYDQSRKLELESSYLQLFQYQNEIIQNSEAEKILVKKNTQRILLIGSVSVVILLIIGVLIFYWRRAEITRRQEDALQKERLINEKNQQEIRSKNEILEIKKMERYRFNKLRADLTKELNEVKPFVKEKEVREKINKICRELEGSEDDDLWNEISQYLPEFNSSFFQKLIKDFPTLSINDRRLCAFLNLNLSTKEIADITRQTPHSINIARFRLRQKLGLNGSSLSLQEFLSKYN